ncbi:TerB family tellurite resistance protein [Bradyrhizobium sp. HKCCYLS20291]|uniref:TerB family tellurite resistance protein n=1 Tax=Bradyrhizobium sp. HKCCYLS20291 TaxID=3420766 RepID=UPI003EB7BE27
MGIFSRIMKQAEQTLNSYTGDSKFLAGVAAAAANVTAADGQIDNEEIDAAISGIQANQILGASYTGSQIEEALTNALNRAKTRSGRLENKRAIEALVTYDITARQDVLAISADVADQGDIGAEEKKVLIEIGSLLGIDAVKFLGL